MTHVEHDGTIRNGDGKRIVKNYIRLVGVGGALPTNVAFKAGLMGTIWCGFLYIHTVPDFEIRTDFLGHKI